MKNKHIVVRIIPISEDTVGADIHPLLQILLPTEEV